MIDKPGALRDLKKAGFGSNRAVLKMPEADRKSLGELLRSLRHLRADLLTINERFATVVSVLHPSHRDSARNLLGYLALRRHDIRQVQEALANLGLSSLGRAEAHILATLNSVIRVVCSVAGRSWKPHPSMNTQITREQGRRIIREHTEALFGPSPKGRSVRIMVTMPAEAAADFRLVKSMVIQGMNCMRINCAHDDPSHWNKMINNLRRAERETHKKCQVLMDLAGPKLRTGPLSSGPKVVKWRPKRDALGKVISPARIWLRAIGGPETELGGLDAVLVVSPVWLSRVKKGDKIIFTDSRNAEREMKAVLGTAEGWLCESELTSYVTEQVVLAIKRPTKTAEDWTQVKLENVPENIEPLLLCCGDTLMLTRDSIIGRPAITDRRGRVQSPATIGCTLPEVFSSVKPGHRIWFDDGKIGGIVKKCFSDRLSVEITYARDKGERLRSEKGINLPDTALRTSALSEKDIADLSFAVRHADLVGMSFVQRISDVKLLQEHIAAQSGRNIGILLKIETQLGFRLLPDLLLTAMRSEKAGVMIARGDLAVECGWERLAEVQEEILWICEAAHVPVVWATQVLETVAKDGRPSRAEITDAAMGQRAECVMLNKGPHILDAIRILDNILRRMQEHQRKKRTLLRRLSFWGSPKRHLKNLQSLPGVHPLGSPLQW
jgi:pyruvate kinase